MAKKKSASKKVVKKKPAAKKAAAASTSKVTVGKSLPAFSIASTGGRTVALSDLKGKSVVLYFYPKDSTPGCTLEGRDFSRLNDQFKKAGSVVFGISRDSMKSHEKFKDKEKYTVDLLSDEDEKVCNLFGVIKMKNMYGRQVRGIERSTFVIDSDGKLVKEWRGVRVPGHADEVLAFVKSL
ncbi:MAG: peroxiredoxin [Bdellovibrionales bacterium]|nr:peroxiredoxin [Bdellovibrionales bacterium]